MNAKVASTIDKAFQDRTRSNFDKALSRLEDGIKKHPKALRLYTEAVDVAMEAGESLKALQFLKQAQRRLPEDGFELWTFAADKVGKYNDPIVGRYLVELAIKNGEVSTAGALLADLKDHTANELLQRVRTKKQAMSTAMGGGFADRDEIISYAITEALLCIRLDRFSEAMEGLMRILDEKPYTHKLLEPFLVDIERQHKNKGEAAFALGCCFLAGEKHAVAVEKLISATATTPALMPDAIKKIESLGDDMGIPLDTRNLKLAELHLAHNDTERAEELIRGVLDRDPAKASSIIELLENHVRANADDLTLQLLFVDAALGLGRRDTAIGQLKKISQKPHLRGDLVAWLEEKTQTPGTASELLLFFGETALAEGMHGRAIEIFKEILSHGIQDEPTIKELLTRHQSVPIIRHFLTDRFGRSTPQNTAPSAAFETFDEFDLAGGPEQTRPAEPEDGQSTAIKQVETKVEDAGPPPAPKKTDTDAAESQLEFGIDNHEFSLGDLDYGAPEEPELERSDSGPGESGGETDDLFAYLNKDFSQVDQPTETEPTSDVPPLAEPSDFAFTSNEDIVELAGEDPAGGTSDMDEDHPEDPPKDLDSLFEMFTGGRLDNRAALELIERALAAGRLDEMRTVLSFAPANIGEDVERKRLLAEYYLEIEKPLSALVALKTVNVNALDKDGRNKHLSRIAACYRALQNFEAAHSVYLRLLSDNPAAAEIERMAACNYDDYLRSVTGCAPALEKVSSL